MKRWIWILLVIPVFGLTILLFPSSPANYSLRLEADVTTVSVGEKVVFTATLKNEAFTVDYPVFNALFIDILREGEVSPITNSIPNIQSFVPFQERSVTESFTFAEPGTYTMTAYCPMTMRIGERVWELEATLVITVIA